MARKALYSSVEAIGLPVVGFVEIIACVFWDCEEVTDFAENIPHADHAGYV